MNSAPTFEIAGLSSIRAGLPAANRFCAKDSVLLPGAALVVNTHAAKFATKWLRRSDTSVDGRR